MSLDSSPDTHEVKKSPDEEEPAKEHQEIGDPDGEVGDLVVIVIVIIALKKLA